MADRAEKSSETLRDMLFEEIASLRSGKSDANRANAVAKIAAQIVASARLDFEYSRYATDGTPLKLVALPMGNGQA